MQIVKLFELNITKKIKLKHEIIVKLFILTDTCRMYVCMCTPLMQSARQAFSAAVRVQFTVCEKAKEYVGDKVDAKHFYHLMGAVWDSVRSYFAEVVPIFNRIEEMFLSSGDAEKAGLPVEEIQRK